VAGGSGSTPATVHAVATVPAPTVLIGLQPNSAGRGPVRHATRSRIRHASRSEAVLR
jgi:hypothetical protein